MRKLNGFQYAWEEIRLFIAQFFIGMAIKITPTNAPELLLLHDLIKKWGEQAKVVKWKPKK